MQPPTPTTTTPRHSSRQPAGAFAYEPADIPAGLTLGQWRELAAGRRRRRRRLIALWKRSR